MLGGGGVEDTVDPVPVKRQVLQQLTTAHRPHLGRRRGEEEGEEGGGGGGGGEAYSSGLCGMGHVGKQVAVLFADNLLATEGGKQCYIQLSSSWSSSVQHF